ncbi:hypothetical protein AB0N73_09610 [Microbacterium sp. NPDC089189]|uniref:hypothetical protein n=1 Tax=Microbacterium sp. NPDC089189 TaxID=3154972 RepID=UPI00344A2529
MGFAFILPTSRRLLAGRDLAAEGRADTAARAAALRHDYERWSRWLLGLVAFVVTIVAGFVATGMVAIIAAFDSISTVDLVVVCAAAIVCVAGGTTLVVLWRSGRVLARAASTGLRAVYGGEDLSPSFWRWARVRLVHGEPRVLARLISGTLALLLAVGGFALVVRDLAAGASLFTLPTLLVAVCSALSGVGQIGGVMRIVQGMSAGDPVYARRHRR